MSGWRDIGTAPRDGTEIIIEDADGVKRRRRLLGR